MVAAHADNRVRELQRDLRQPGGTAVQYLRRGARSGQDHAAQIGAILVDHVQRDRGSEINYDQRTAVMMISGVCVAQSVGADLLRFSVPDLEKGAGFNRDYKRGPVEARLRHLQKAAGLIRHNRGKRHG